MSGTERTTIVRLQRGWLLHLSANSNKPGSTSRVKALRMTAKEAADLVGYLTRLNIYARAEAA